MSGISRDDVELRSTGACFGPRTELVDRKEGIMSGTKKSWDYEWVENGYLVERGVTEDVDALIVQIEAAEEETARLELEFANACIELDGDEPLESMTMSGRISFWPTDDPEGMASDWAWTHDFECVATLEGERS